MKAAEPLKTPKQCPECGRELLPGAPAGLCPACLLEQGMASETSQGDSRQAFEPPSVERLAELFPQLEILGLIGKGGMGAVYRARQPALDRVVALKILPAQGERKQKSTERFNREARALARLNHPHIVAVHEFGQAGELHYFLMEYVDGVNLRQLQRSGRISPREALQIVPQICEALQYAHDAGVVHRDIKPENVLVDRQGRVKIADFGLARLGEVELAELRLTGEGQVLGTPHYMAPEQVEHPLEVDHRADIYALGVVFYELLTGELPLGKFQPPSSASRRVQLDVRLDDVVLRALEKEPSRRYQHVSEVKTDVEGITASSPVAELPPVIPERATETEERWRSQILHRRKRLIWAGFFVSIVLAPVGLDLSLHFLWVLSLVGIIFFAWKIWGCPIQQPLSEPAARLESGRSARYGVSVLGILALGGLLAFLHTAQSERLEGTVPVAVTEIGYPDPWYQSEVMPEGTVTRLIRGMTTSFWLGLLGVGALVGIVVLDRRYEAREQERGRSKPAGADGRSEEIWWLRSAAMAPGWPPRIMLAVLGIMTLMAGWKLTSLPGYGARVIVEVLLMLGLVLRLRVAYGVTLFFAVLGMAPAFLNPLSPLTLGILALNGIVVAGVVGCTRWFFPAEGPDRGPSLRQVTITAVSLIVPAILLFLLSGGFAALGLDVDATELFFIGVLGLPLSVVLGAALAWSVALLGGSSGADVGPNADPDKRWCWQAVVGLIVFTVSLPFVGGMLVMGRLIAADPSWNPALEEALVTSALMGVGGLGAFTSLVLAISLIQRIRQRTQALHGEAAAWAVAWFWALLVCSVATSVSTIPPESRQALALEQEAQARALEEVLEAEIIQHLHEAGFEADSVEVTVTPGLTRAFCQLRAVSEGDGMVQVPFVGGIKLRRIDQRRWEAQGTGLLNGVQFTVELGKTETARVQPLAAEVESVYGDTSTDSESFSLVFSNGFSLEQIAMQPRS